VWRSPFPVWPGKGLEVLSPVALREVSVRRYLVLAAVSISTILAVMVILNLIGLTIAAFVIMRRK
jgi:hypothetical protein